MLILSRPRDFLVHIPNKEKKLSVRAYAEHQERSTRLPSPNITSFTIHGRRDLFPKIISNLSFF